MSPLGLGYKIPVISIMLSHSVWLLLFAHSDETRCHVICWPPIAFKEPNPASNHGNDLESRYLSQPKMTTDLANILNVAFKRC